MRLQFFRAGGMRLLNAFANLALLLAVGWIAYRHFVVNKDGTVDQPISERTEARVPKPGMKLKLPSDGSNKRKVVVALSASCRACKEIKPTVKRIVDCAQSTGVDFHWASPDSLPQLSGFLAGDGIRVSTAPVSHRALGIQLVPTIVLAKADGTVELTKVGLALEREEAAILRLIGCKG